MFSADTCNNGRECGSWRSEEGQYIMRESIRRDSIIRECIISESIKCWSIISDI